MKDLAEHTDLETIFQANFQTATAQSALATAVRAKHGGHQPQDLQEIVDWVGANKPHDLQHLRVFQDTWGYGPAKALCLDSEAPDAYTPAPKEFDSLLAWFDVAFPKSKRNLHPRLDLRVSLDRYKKVREGVRRSIRGCMGAYEARAARDVLQDGWTALLDLLEPLAAKGGPLDKRSLGRLKSFADIARRAGVEPWQLSAETLEAVDDVFVTSEERTLAKRVIRMLNMWKPIIDFDDLLPSFDIPDLPARRLADELPPHIERRIDQLVAKAGTRVDINTSKAHNTVTKQTQDVYRAALRYHVKLLPFCPTDADVSYDNPISDLASVNNIDELFASEHISATIRATENREHLPSALQADTALSYYKVIRLVISRNSEDFGPSLATEINRRLNSSEYFKDAGRDEMPEHIKAWCRELLNDPVKERRFHNLHRIFLAKAEEIMTSATGADGKFDAEQLSESDRIRLVRLGVCAAVCAIVLTGRPLRLRNAIWLRHRGRRANINPEQGWKFFIPAEEAKSGKKLPEMSPRKDRHGPAVLDWYLKFIRPLIDPEDQSIYLFPSIRSPGGRLAPATFRNWFQAAANDAKIPMTFHRFRHGFASILIRRNTPMRIIADMLGNTPGVCSKRYAFLDPDMSAKQAQDAMSLAAAEAEKTIRKRRCA